MKITSALIFFACLVATAASLSCYHQSTEDSKAAVRHGKQFCTAVYHVSLQYGFFSGGDRDPSTIRNIQKLHDGQDCLHVKEENNMNEDPFEAYYCYCFESYCNSPLQWNEFKNRGFTLKANSGHFDA